MPPSLSISLIIISINLIISTTVYKIGLGEDYSLKLTVISAWLTHISINFSGITYTHTLYIYIYIYIYIYTCVRECMRACVCVSVHNYNNSIFSVTISDRWRNYMSLNCPVDVTYVFTFSFSRITK